MYIKTVRFVEDKFWDLCSLHRPSFIKKDQNKFWNENSDKIYQQKLNCRTESIGIVISEHETFSSDSLENKVTTTVEGGFFFLQYQIISE